MGILDRISTLLKSNMNAAIDAMSDPGKEIEQVILDMEEQLRRARGEVRDTLAQEKVQEKKLTALRKSADEWEGRATKAVEAGDDALAKEALGRKAEIDAQVEAAEKSLAEQGAYVDQLSAALKQLEQRLTDVKSRKETLKAKARANKGAGVGGGRAFQEFDRLAGKVDTVEAEAELNEELAVQRHEDEKSRDAERKLNELSKSKDLDDRLAALKAKIDKKD
jgi:phage shock protein A